MSRDIETADSDQTGEHAQTQTICETKRRRLLGLVATGSSIALAGCAGFFEYEYESPEQGVSTEETDEEDDEVTEDNDEGTEDNDEIDEPEDDEINQETYDVEYVGQSETIQIPPDQNLLVAGEEKGWDLPYACRAGFCGQCLARADGDAHDLVEMTVNDYDPLDDDAIADGYLLTCTGHPRDDFALENGKYGELGG